MIVKVYRHYDTHIGAAQWSVKHKREGHWPVHYHYFGDPPKTVQKWIASPARTVQDNLYRAGTLVQTIWS